jgi:hypothetical protein
MYPGVRRRDDHVLIGDQILDPEVAGLVDDFRAPRIAVLVANRLQLVDYDADEQLVVGEDCAQFVDRQAELGQLVQNLLALEAGQPLQLHVQNGLRLDGREAELSDQARACLDGILRAADQRDHRIEVIERNLETLEDVARALRPCAARTRSAASRPRGGTR